MQYLLYYFTCKVGAGTAGCVIASRLSEISNLTILLVEAGGHFGWVSSIPILAPVLQKTDIDWSYSTEPQIYSSKGFWNHVNKHFRTINNLNPLYLYDS